MGEWVLRNQDYEFSIVEKDGGRLICRCDSFKEKALLISDAHNRTMRRVGNVI